MTGDREALLTAAMEDEYAIACPCPLDHASRADEYRERAYACSPAHVAHSPAGSPS
ncbi:hypothetical protein AB0C10_36960 [Microbispora amethystogenes]|uniref:hypothetical protein n=1 Tax=Microbispora amethystogenes TaxID=1427754 RepID=UPI0033EB29F5